MDTDTLAHRRERLGLSRPALAKLLDVSPATVWRWETGKFKPNAIVARHVDQVLARLERRADPRRAEEGRG